MRHFLLWTAVSAALCTLSLDARAGKMKFGDEGVLEVYGYLQPRVDFNLDVGEAQTPYAKTSANKKFDFSIRRARMVLRGGLTPRWQFFLGTMTAWYGAGGNFSADVMFSDAWAEYVLARYFRLQAGLIKGAFARESLLSGAKTHGIEWHGFFLKRAVGDPSGRYPPFRDMGLMVRGIVDLPLGSIDYRLGVFDGKEPGGGADNPRFAGRIAYNFFDAEPEYLISDAYLGLRKILSVGFSYDVQAHVAVPAGAGIDSPLLYDPNKATYAAFAFDAHADIPFGPHGIVASYAFFYYANAIAVERETLGSIQQLPQGKGWGMYGEVGYRYKRYEPILGMDYFAPAAASAAKRMNLVGGFNWWIMGHSVNLKAQFGLSKIWSGETSARWGEVLTIQSQVFFK